MQRPSEAGDPESASRPNYQDVTKDRELPRPLLTSIVQLLQFWFWQLTGNSSKMEKHLIPTGAVQFPGSFAPDLRRDSREYVTKRTLENVVRSYFTDGWGDVSIWKSAFVEFVGSTCLCYLAAVIYITVGSFGTTQAAAYVGLSNVVLISLFIYALAPASGGHINPMITFATMITGLTGFSRGALYMTAQIIGAGLAGGLIRGSFGRELTLLYNGGGCFLKTTLITTGQSYLIESVSAFILLFLSFGVGLDPRQALVFGPKLGPFLVSCSLGLVTFATVGLGAGYPGAQINPGRCFAYAVARGEFENQWIWWVGPITGAVAMSIVYHIAPPYHREELLERHAPHG